MHYLGALVKVPLLPKIQVIWVREAEETPTVKDKLRRNPKDAWQHRQIKKRWQTQCFFLSGGFGFLEVSLLF
jgi:hypothetical protein